MGWERDHQHEAAMRQAAVSVQPGQEWRGEAPKAYRMGALHALVSRDEIAPGDLRWHISLSRNDRIPTWDELAKCAHSLRPGVMFAVPIPPRDLWINLHKNTLHVHEIHDDPLTSQWRHEGRIMRSAQTGGKSYA